MHPEINKMSSLKDDMNQHLWLDEYRSLLVKYMTTKPHALSSPGKIYSFMACFCYILIDSVLPFSLMKICIHPISLKLQLFVMPTSFSVFISMCGEHFLQLCCVMLLCVPCYQFSMFGERLVTTRLCCVPCYEFSMCGERLLTTRLCCIPCYEFSMCGERLVTTRLCCVPCYEFSMCGERLVTTCLCCVPC